MTSKGYPGPYASGVPIRGLNVEPTADAVIFHAGTAAKNGDLVTAGGRVLGITGLGKTIAEARAAAYRTTSMIGFEGCHYRHDIAHLALAPRI
jgi:phosphoribosylamine--glycine ligase